MNPGGRMGTIATYHHDACHSVRDGDGENNEAMNDMGGLSIFSATFTMTHIT